MRPSPVLAGWLIACLSVGPIPAAAADTVAGERLFRSQCSGCHSVEAGQNRAGPTLHNLFGRRSGALEGFDYSNAMRQAGIEWTPDSLDEFLTDPSAMVPGTKMVFWGLPPDQRRQIAAYLEGLPD